MNAREVIAEALDAQTWMNEGQAPICAEIALSALSEAGFTVERLEFAGRYTEDGVDGPCMYWDGAGDLFRISGTSEETET